MLSFQVRGGREAAVRVAAAMKVFKRATSLGGTESLIEHRSSIEPPDSPTPDNLLRASVGLEHSEDLLDDLEQALAVLEC
jgi:cystathionine gamma-synthase